MVFQPPFAENYLGNKKQHGNRIGFGQGQFSIKFQAIGTVKENKEVKYRLQYVVGKCHSSDKFKRRHESIKPIILIQFYKGRYVKQTLQKQTCNNDDR